ncbi:hypothetical protein [Streptomyces sp. NBC_01217]|uniref:hypothetical protein n=1 Tax=Streptomyces sp. NBC_01217 TaxID=2903779 RepID=UPI002E12BE1D|nr:hypothetical protein OG507_20935 [Streptomyces sp. NBC_01217]
MIDYDDDAAEAEQLDDVADFDAFFAEQAEPERKGLPLRMYGRTYHLPPSLPLLFTLQLDRLKSSARPEDIRNLLASLFGPDAVEHWTDARMSDRRLGIVLKWATANVAKPGSLTMERAAELYDEQEAAKEAAKATAGKARPAKVRTKATPKKKSAPRPSSSGTR